MDPINRNDPYEAANPVELNAMTRIDPYSAMQTGATSHPQDPFYIFRVVGVVVGIVIVLAGVYFAGASFVILRGVLEEPQRLNAYLDEWYVPPRDETPAHEEAPAAEQTKNLPEAAQPAPETPAEPSAIVTPPSPPAPAPAAEAPAPVPPAVNADAKAKPAPPQPKPLVHKNSRVAAKDESPVSQAIELITDALTRGGLPRLAGALILLLLASMVIRIPFGLLKAGIELIRAMIPDRTESAP